MSLEILQRDDPITHDIDEHLSLNESDSARAWVYGRRIDRSGLDEDGRLPSDLARSGSLVGLRPLLELLSGVAQLTRRQLDADSGLVAEHEQIRGHAPLDDSSVASFANSWLGTKI